MSHELHTYQCSFCKMVATRTVKANPKCALCFRIMAFLFSTPISAAEWAERSRQPIEFRSPHPVSPNPERVKRCARMGCTTHKRVSELLNGRFCSEECGAQDSRDLAAILERVEAIYQKNPWLRPREKESA